LEENTPLTTEDAIAQLGGPINPDPATPPESDPPANPPTDPPADNNPPADDANNPPAEPDKQQQAFIHQRQQITQMNKLLKGIGKMLDLGDSDLSDETKLTAALQAKITAKEAESQHVPVELLTRLQQLEQRDMEYTAAQRNQNAALGFQRVKDQYGLTQEQLNGFATELVQRGLNPLEIDGVNVVEQYQTLHFNEILQAEVAKAVAAEQERAAKANSTASTPDKKNGNGGGGNEPGKVDSVRGLEQWLQQNVK
jgi:hypothetical protein